MAVSSTQAQDPNIYQLYFIPAKSVMVRYFVHQAGELSESRDLFQSRWLSVACIVVAVVFSAFNALSYLLQIPLKIPLNIVRYDLPSLFTDPILDFCNFARSLVFVAFSATLVVWGIFDPATVFPFFAPPVKRDPEEVIQELSERIDSLDKEKKKLEKIKEDLQENLDQALGNGHVNPQLQSDEELARKLQEQLNNN